MDGQTSEKKVTLKQLKKLDLVGRILVSWRRESWLWLNLWSATADLLGCCVACASSGPSPWAQ